ncbi:hypothetical protein LIER_19148 [Lithospermum erythrorhizon]|uniref:Retrotransposon gag domain-containing protein n=1 Tax=Lithospermum erythrorhizon TaxID=34254 RepID=A0AAV3QKK8_LITER
MPAGGSRKECKTKMSFTDRLDGVPLSKGFVFPQFIEFGGSGDPIKYLQGFLAKMIITSNNPNIYAKAFSNSLTDKALDWYGKLKKELVLETALSKDQLTTRVKQYVELEELKTMEGQGRDLPDVIACKRTRSKSPRKNSVWERIQGDWGKTSKRRQAQLRSSKPQRRQLHVLDKQIYKIS